MKRRAVITLSLLGLAAAGTGGAVAASAAAPVAYKNQVCIVTSSDPTHSSNQAFCISWSAPGQ